MPNHNSRLEAFCDGVFAIAITLLIIEIRIPVPEHISTTHDLWLALKHILPSVFAVVLSFGIILITWVNHHSAMRLVHRSSYPFIYSNGFLLLTVVFMPFPTALLGEYLFTDHASPAVMLYSGIDGLQAIGWILITSTALSPNLTKDEKSTSKMKEMKRNAYFAVLLYTICAVVAFWFPLTIAGVITVIWIIWLVYGMSLTEK